RGGERHVLDFIGRAPRAADATRCTEDELAGGPKSCATPGNLGGWLAALNRFGTMDRLRVLAPAIEHAERGVPLTFKNVEFFEPEWREPVTITYRGRRIYSMPPPFSAFQMLETLNILEGYELQAWGHNSVDYLHHLIEAVKLASADRLAYAYAGEAPITGLLS